MEHLRRLLFSSIGRKMMMALTGLALIGFLVTHLAGNLLLFRGRDTFNHYSHALITNPLIYGAELILLALFVWHLLQGILLTFRNREARPVPYERTGNAGHTSRRSFSSGLMIFSGLVVLAFVPMHILHFKYGAHYPAPEAGVRDIYRLVIESFHDQFQVAWYMLAMAVIGFHLWHGFGSAFETLGVRYRRLLSWGCKALAVAIAVGFGMIPVMVYFSK